ncbi:MAG: NAD(P)-dependent oxidoreductase [Planctomycetota bacterium]|nr:NAD(P)-dependent oxidoreductase [Planctomycetota bacterium]
MKVLVTGAAGRMGRESCAALLADGHEVVGVDLAAAPAPGKPGGMPVRVADLRDRDAVEAAFGKPADRYDAVVHLGNHTSYKPADARMIFNENVAMNTNVFESAIEHGATRIVFASSVQVITSQPELPDDKPQPTPAYIPFDGDSPARPTNPYALSKRVGEVMLDYYTRVHRASCVALRLPWMGTDEDIVRMKGDKHRRSPYDAPMGWSYLSYADAGRLAAAVVRADLPGFRVYFPSSRLNRKGGKAAEIVRRHLADVPQRSPIRDDGSESLVDIARITQETGWEPRD